MTGIATFAGIPVGTGVRGSIATLTTYQVLPAKCKHGAGNGKAYQVQYPYTIPPNPRTPAQQAWRAIFVAGTVAWAALSPEEKAEWEIDALVEEWEAKRNGKLYKAHWGWHLFMSEYLKTH